MLFCFELYNCLEVGDYIRHSRETHASQDYEVSHSFVTNTWVRVRVRVCLTPVSCPVSSQSVHTFPLKERRKDLWKWAASADICRCVCSYDQGPWRAENFGKKTTLSPPHPHPPHPWVAPPFFPSLLPSPPLSPSSIAFGKGTIRMFGVAASVEVSDCQAAFRGAKVISEMMERCRVEFVFSCG